MNGKRNKYVKTSFTDEKIERPNKETLINDFKVLGSFVQVGKKYHVCDKAVKKWFIKYNLPSKSKEIKEFINSYYK